MKLDNNTKEIVKEFAPHIEEVSARWKIIIIGLIAVILFGVYALYRQVVDGHIITGMRDNVVWGLYIVNFIFFIGISYAGALISGILHLLQVEWRKPIIRIAEIITVISTIIGPIYILLCVGRLDRLHHLFIYARIQSPITWDVIAISTYVIGSILFLYLAMIRDFAILRDSVDLKVGKFRRWSYKFFAMGFNGTPKQDKLLDDSINIMSAIIIPVAIIVHSVLAWIFSMTLRPGWHSTIFGPYFVVAAIFSGTGVLIIALWAYRKIYKLEEYITEKHFNYLGMLFLILAAIYGYFTLSEYLTEWYSSKVWDAQLLDKLFSFQEYGWWFFFAAIVGVLLPIIVIGIPKLRSINSIVIVSAISVLALWVKRYLIIIPTLETPLLPVQDTRIEFIKYSATWVEWALTFGGIATFILFFMLMSKYMPIIPISLVSKPKKDLDFFEKIEKVKTA
jgi:Ni/Fe-hydrogenase subunit HybB-like protein